MFEALSSFFKHPIYDDDTFGNTRYARLCVKYNNLARVNTINRNTIKLLKHRNLFLQEESDKQMDALEEARKKYVELKMSVESNQDDFTLV